jgi:hypothetical protein
MTRALVLMIILSILAFAMTTSRATAFSETRIDFAARQRTICDFTFAPVDNMVVIGKPIREKDLKNRVDNERYDACPYTVEIYYKSISVRVDFSRDITLQTLKELGQDDSVSTAFFRYNSDGWTAAGDDIVIPPSEITTHEKANSLTVSGVVRRKNQKTKKDDFCFGLMVIGEENYLTGAVCRRTDAELEPLKALFSKQSVIWSGR